MVKPERPQTERDEDDDVQRIGAHFDFGFEHDPGSERGSWKGWTLAASALGAFLAAIVGLISLLMSLIAKLCGIGGGGQ